ncbi:MAG: nucleotidyltransferase family protein [Acidobacteriota bacterium]|nr:nucleotidyltransferase family protein [Acidobacteriota bacterium]
MLSAVVLAAGASRRMGAENKLLMSWRGRPLIAHMVHTLHVADIGEVIVVLGHQAQAVQAVLPEGARTVFNARWEEGMTTTIAAGVNAASETEGYLICLADQPLLQAGDLQDLADQFRLGLARDRRCIGVPFYRGRRGNPVFFARAWRSALLSQSGQGGCRPLVKANPRHVLPLEAANDHVLLDMDTPQAREELLSRSEPGPPA